MKLLPRVLLVSAVLSSLSFGGLVNGIAIIINKEPITLYEIYKYAEHFKISKKESLELLIRQRLEDAQIKAEGIQVDSFEVDSYIQSLAQKNGMSEFDFVKMLKAQNIDIETYKKDLQTKLKRDRLYQMIVRQKMQTIGEKELQDFYNANQSEFEVANNLDVITYTSSNQEDLKAISTNPMLKPEGILIKEESLKYKNLNSKLQALLGQTKIREFSPIIRLENGFVMFYVKEKSDISYLPFGDMKESIYNVLYKQQEQKILDDYFEKLKSSASIEVLRNPT